MSEKNNPGQSYTISNHSKMSPHNQLNAFSLPGVHVFGTIDCHATEGSSPYKSCQRA